VARVRESRDEIVAEPGAGDGFHHEPVMVSEVLEHLQVERGGWYLDGTLGGAGHARAVLERDDSVRLLGLDRDPDAVDAASGRLEGYGDRVKVVHADFRDAEGIVARELGGEELRGALLDLGVSSHQIDESARGFSFRPGTPLNMRMGGTTGGRRPAADFLNHASEEEIGRVFRDYGEERRWRAVAREICQRRELRPFRTSDDLVEALEAARGRSLPPGELARLFQAVRIEVNDELDALRTGLPAIRRSLAPGGRLVVISYHSLEDRIVKRAFREWSRDCICPPKLPVCRCRGHALGRAITSGPRRPTAEEVRGNRRARSARLRGWEKATGPDA
jgi:16S rRNA (cytosine1402-N4)-methyltransferase